jgi:hypothetical protein
VRDGQHHSIMQCLLASGCWVQVDIPSGYRRIEAVRKAEVPRLERVNEQFYINLYPENLFGLAVDGDLCEVPHICAWNPVLVETSFHPFPDRNHTQPALLSDTGTRFTPPNPDQSPPPIRSHRTPVYIPTISRYIDACLSRHPRLCHLSDAPRLTGNGAMDISYLVRYLFLESDTQRAKLLPALSDEKKDAMKALLDRYKRTVKADLRLWVNSKGMLTSRPPKAEWTGDVGCIDNTHA